MGNYIDFGGGTGGLPFLEEVASCFPWEKLLPFPGLEFKERSCGGTGMISAAFV